jgi:hypothetical protein
MAVGFVIETTYMQDVKELSWPMRLVAMYKFGIEHTVILERVQSEIKPCDGSYRHCVSPKKA